MNEIGVFIAASGNSYSSTPMKYFPLHLKVQSCKLYNSKYMIASIQITNTEILAFVSVLIFKIFSRKVLFTNRKGNRNC